MKQRLGSAVAILCATHFPVQQELDAALSHMLRLQEGEERADRPAVIVLAMRFKDPAMASETMARIQYDFRRPGLRIAREKGIVLIQAPSERLPKECDSALWEQELSRLRTIAN